MNVFQQDQCLQLHRKVEPFSKLEFTCGTFSTQARSYQQESLCSVQVKGDASCTWRCHVFLFTRHWHRHQPSSSNTPVFYCLISLFYVYASSLTSSTQPIARKEFSRQCSAVFSDGFIRTLSRVFSWGWQKKLLSYWLGHLHCHIRYLRRLSGVPCMSESSFVNLMPCSWVSWTSQQILIHGQRCVRLILNGKQKLQHSDACAAVLSCQHWPKLTFDYS